MCELFGLSGKNSLPVTGMLREFFSHSPRHPHGWGMAVFYENAVSLEKEPVMADSSAYLRERLRHGVEARNMLAHIRWATRGSMDYENCHPFVMRDNRNRAWTLIHNGTIFDCPELNEYVHVQEGLTDSERILCRIVDLVSQKQREMGRSLAPEERFRLLDEMVCRISPRNKLNLLLYDGELLYAHTNYADSLYTRRIGDSAVFATVPLDRESWEPVPFTTLLAYRDGREVFRGTCHGQEYRDNPNDMRLLFMDYSEL